jgi:hypothetical protein
MLASAGAGAYAASSLQEIKAFLNKGVKFTVSGKSWAPKDANGKAVYPITYNGTTYLPIRTAGSALGVEIGWDAANNTVNIGGEAHGVVTPGGSTTTGNVGFSRSKPASIGTTLKYSVDDIFNQYSAEITLEEVIRGEPAWKMIKVANKFKDNPASEGYVTPSGDTTPKGYEYLLAKVNFKLLSNRNEEAAHDLGGYQFFSVSAAGKDYNTVDVVAPDPSLDAKLYVGASHRGWVALLVKKDDVAPLITYGRDYDGTKGIWFKTK